MFVTTIMLSWNEAKLLPYALRNAKKYSDRIVIYDDGSTDDTVAIAKAGGAEVVDFSQRSGGRFDEATNVTIKNTEYQKMHGDWFFIHDMDEFPYYDGSMRELLAAYTAGGITLPRVEGYGMFPMTDEPLAPDADLTECMRYGIQDGGYSKRVLVNKMVDIRYGMGSHVCNPRGLVRSSTTTDIKLLHYKHFLGLEYSLARKQQCADRMSARNLQNKLSLHYYAFTAADWTKSYEDAKRDAIEVIKRPGQAVL